MQKVKRFPSTRIFQLRVELDDVEPPVWRTFYTYDDISMYQLHELLQVTMGWMNSHLFGFEKGNLVISIEENEENDFMMVREFRDAKRTKLRDVIGTVGEHITYTYDFGDSWDHTLTLEKVLRAEELTHNVPRCSAGANACPPEDCGGPPGFDHLKTTLADPRSEKYLDTVHWLDHLYPDYNPHEFSLTQVNRALRLGPRRYLKLQEKMYEY